MSTLAELRSRITRTMGLYGAVPIADNNAQILDCLNDALIGIARKRKWYWWLEEDTTTLAGLASGTSTSNMPSNFGRIECILDPDSAVIVPKTTYRQLHYPEKIGSSSYQTYAMGGIDSTTRLETIFWSPKLLTGGDYTLWYYRIPAKLSDDSDEPDLPNEFHDYLYWRSLHMMLLADEERASLIDRCKAEAFEVYQSMEQKHARTIETLSRRIYATA